MNSWLCRVRTPAASRFKKAVGEGADGEGRPWEPLSSRLLPGSARETPGGALPSRSQRISSGRAAAACMWRVADGGRRERAGRADGQQRHLALCRRRRGAEPQGGARSGSGAPRAGRRGGGNTCAPGPRPSQRCTREESAARAPPQPPVKTKTRRHPQAPRPREVPHPKSRTAGFGGRLKSHRGAEMRLEEAESEDGVSPRQVGPQSFPTQFARPRPENQGRTACQANQDVSRE